MIGKFPTGALAATAALLVLCLFGLPSAAEDRVQANLHGIDIIAFEPQTDRIDGIPTTSMAVALERLSAALNRLVSVSPWAKKRIDRLLKKGDIHLYYDARHPVDTMTEVNIAAYFPEYYNPAEDLRTFVVLVGRTGIQWSLDELAGALAHELAGHAIQQLEGRIEGMRLLDIECEAYLIHERANQDLGLDKTTNEAIGLRNAMDYHWCDDFRRFTQENRMPVAAQWDALNPDIPALLTAFHAYLADQSD